MKSRGGLGSKEMQMNLTNVTKLRTYPHPLVDRVGEEVTQKNLNKLISAQLILKPVKIREHISGKRADDKRSIKRLSAILLGKWNNKVDGHRYLIAE